jgi:predicted NAD/FAD-binding protein
MHNHHLLQLTGKPNWLTIAGGRCAETFLGCSLRSSADSLYYSRVYVDRIRLKLLKDRVHLGNPVAAVKVDDSSAQRKVLLQTEDGNWDSYDHVILACHSDAALAILQKGGSVVPRERELLQKFQWNKNEAVLHTDTRVGGL